ncbi:hypothetical protein [Catellatospora methionotrophica]|uniref:hypothetical protein n=1 Tax=Catellatospora methionotrophica TaxID=121620 RepID=UPI0033FF778A
MQMKKAGVVATGALATLAILGAPAAAAPTDASVLGASSTEGKVSAMRQVGANQLQLARGGGSWDNDGWDAPWDIDPQALVSTLNGTVVTTAPFQGCGSTAAFGAGAAAPITSPNTLVAGGFQVEGYGDRHDDAVACANGNTRVTQSDEVPLVAIGNNTVVTAAALQACGSTASFAVGVATPITSPNTVIGGCQNGNVEINAEHDGWQESARVEGKNLDQVTARMALASKVAALKDRKSWSRQSAARVTPQARGGGWDAPWDVDPFGLAATANGTAVVTATLQACGSTAPFVVGIAAPITSPNTVIGDCKNANIKIDQQDASALVSAANNTAISLANIQACGSTMSAGVGAAVPITSPNTVIGSCFNANTLID